MYRKVLTLSYTCFLDCINCGKHLYVKGEAAKEAALRRHFDELRGYMVTARQTLDDDQLGADEWVKYSGLTTEHAEQLVETLDNPLGPPGSFIRPRNVKGGSRLEQVALRISALPVRVPPLPARGDPHG
ncbi:hypothetical protein J2785_003359 [Burkholderia ambifaria]|nr:hypothetical protein [Burkholderia ambifaria]MDR6500203.1 hypothetical protein [Burkholderia ambifaria]